MGDGGGPREEEGVVVREKPIDGVTGVRREGRGWRGGALEVVTPPRLAGRVGWHTVRASCLVARWQRAMARRSQRSRSHGTHARTIFLDGSEVS